MTSCSALPHYVQPIIIEYLDTAYNNVVRLCTSTLHIVLLYNYAVDCSTRHDIVNGHYAHYDTHEEWRLRLFERRFFHSFAAMTEPSNMARYNTVIIVE